MLDLLLQDGLSIEMLEKLSCQSVGAELRNMYDAGFIKKEQQFKEVFASVLSRCETR